MRRITPVLTLALALSASGIATASKHAKPAAKKSAANAMVTCPIMKQKVLKSKATAVKTKSGKTVYVCCKSCIEPAKKL